MECHNVKKDNTRKKHKKHERNKDVDNITLENINSEPRKKRKKGKKCDADNTLYNSDNGERRHKKKNHNFNHSLGKVSHKKRSFDIGQDLEMPHKTVLNSDHTSEKAVHKINAEQQNHFEQSITEKLTHKSNDDKIHSKKRKKKYCSDSLANESTTEKLNEKSRTSINQQNIEEINFMNSNKRCETIEEYESADDGCEDEVWLSNDVSFENIEVNSEPKKKQKKGKNDSCDSDNIPYNSENRKKRHKKKKKICNFDHTSGKVSHKKRGFDIDQDLVEMPHETVQNSDLNKPTSEKISHKINIEKQNCYERSITEKMIHERSDSKTHKRKKKYCSDSLINESTQEKLSEESRSLISQQNTEEINFINSNKGFESTESYESSDDECDIYDFAEEELTFDPPLLHFKGSCSGLTAEQKNEIRELGIPVRYGKWSEKEDEILKHNWNKFAKKHRLRKPHLLLGLNSKKEPHIMKFIRAKKFYFKLGKGLNTRPIHNIYLRARKLFNPYNDNKEISPDLLEEIEKLQSIHGNKWSAIGKLLEKNYHSVSEIVRWHKKGKELGYWKEEEDEKLIEAIKSILKINDITMVHQGIPWEEVAKLVPSRNAKQCRAHWTLQLCWKVNNPNEIREKWNDSHTVHLVHCLYNSSAENEEDVDWIELYEKFPNVASYSALRAKWGEIRREVPGYAEKEFEDIVTYLYKINLPVLVARLGKSSIEEVLESL